MGGGKCSDLDEKSVTTFVVVMGGRKGLLESTKMDFMRLRMNYSKQCSRRRFPQRVSINLIGS